MSRPLDELFAEYEAEQSASAPRETPEARERHRQKVAAEHERGVRLGWHDDDGEPLETDEQEDEEE